MSLEPFRTLTGVAAPLLLDNVDTDAIIPSREIRSVGKTGLAAGLFAGWRSDPQFVLNQPAHAGACILLGGSNFGCGSSREHAVWALREYGIRAILAQSFAPIFFDNCVNNGVLAAALPAAALRRLAEAVRPPGCEPVSIDLLHNEASSASTGALRFTIDPLARLRLLEGLDAVELTLRDVSDIAAFEARDRRLRPWVYLGGNA